MNKLNLLSSFISVGLIQQDHIVLGILLMISVYITYATFINAQNKK